MKAILKNCLLLVSFILFFLSINSQNLITNGSFEVYEDCPTLGSLSNGIIPQPWLRYNTPDFYCECEGSSLPLPNMWDGAYQNAKFGIGLIGFVNFYLNNQFFREYLMLELNDILINNSCYYIEYYVNIYDSSKFGTKHIYLNFSDSLPIVPSEPGDTLNFNKVLCLNKNIYPFDNKIIKDTMNWTKISGIYKANGSEKFITIGNFDYNEEIDTINYRIHNVGVMDGCYILIDDISIFPIITDTMLAQAGLDTNIMYGDSVFIGLEITNLDCKWTNLNTGEVLADSISGIWVKPTENTTYLVEQDLCGTISYDTVTVFVNGVGLEKSTFSPSKGENVQILPNPNNGSFTIQPLGLAIQQLTLYDAQGRKIRELDKNSTKFELNLSKGVYFIEIISEKNRNIEKMVVN